MQRNRGHWTAGEVHLPGYPTTRTAVDIAHMAHDKAATATRWATLAVIINVITLTLSVLFNFIWR